MFWKNKTFDDSGYKDEINSFTQSDIDSILANQNALKVTVTRHPLARFASAWAQKFKEYGEFDKGREQWLRDWPGLEKLLINGTTHRIPFDSFVDYFLTVGPNKERCFDFRFSTDALKLSCSSFLKISHFLEQILMEHIE